MSPHCLLLLQLTISLCWGSHVLLIYTGGTIGMKKVDGHYEPSPGYLNELMAASPQFQNASLPLYDILEYDPLLDSSNMNSSHWIRIARDIETHYHRYTGFVVIHGTDTLAFTASALSFLLENLQKPVIVTGSQVPLCEAVSDAALNLLGSIVAAGTVDLPEVLVFFENSLLRGNRVQKENAFSFGAFQSGGYNHIGFWGGELRLDSTTTLPRREGPLKVQNKMSDDVVIMMVYPGISATFVDQLLSSSIKGVVILAYGMGNGPDENKEFMQALKNANDRGIILIDASQCFKGLVDLEHYATGNSMAEVGCIGAIDMTPEAAYTKLSWLLGKDLPVEQVKELMVTNLRGELRGLVQGVSELTVLQIVILTMGLTTAALSLLYYVTSKVACKGVLCRKTTKYTKLND
ncbi:hypothetical protein GEMRC1_001982 [Eukaryota sp. GEM-RC1]